MSSRVLFLGAHPDDEMACSGYLRRLADEGAQISAVTFSDCDDLIPEGYTVDDLVGEWRTAMSLLGVSDVTLLDVPNRRFPEFRQTILAALDGYRGKYDLVLCPAPSDAHQDHHTVTLEAIRAFKHTTLMGYELPMNCVGDARRTGYVRLTPALMDVKVRHAAAYRSQSLRPYMDPDYIRALARVRGVQAGCRDAEAYDVIRSII
jgi:N-acetylglucosamine malate deacetylase 1